jgi:hypothetical protein
MSHNEAKCCSGLTEAQAGADTQLIDAVKAGKDAYVEKASGMTMESGR